MSGDDNWGRLNRELIEHASARQWGRVRNVYIAMAQQLGREKNYRNSVLNYLIVCLYDANGPNNLPIGGRPGNKEAKDFGYIANEILPGIVGRMLIQAEKAAMSRDDLRAMFFDEVADFHIKIMPLSVAEAWAKIEPELS